MSESLNIDELKKRRYASLVSSKNAIREHPAEYRELKDLVQSILSGPIDVSEYYPVANRLSFLLRKMMGTAPESVFGYFFRHIDPKQEGAIRYFRATCYDLNEQIRHVDQFRAEAGKLRRVK